MDKKNSGGGGIGFVGLLTIVFITLKLTRVIAWSWWWVLSPLWISVAVVALIGIIAVFVALLRKRPALPTTQREERRNVSACRRSSPTRTLKMRCGTASGTATPAAA